MILRDILFKDIGKGYFGKGYWKGMFLKCFQNVIFQLKNTAFCGFFIFLDF